MLNLSYIFDDANAVLAKFADRLTVAPLPAAVYMMQVDLLNHYRYALSHDFTLALDTRSLQNSSHGTPYQKWAFFVNQDFAVFSFAAHNLLRYTSRLVHQAGCMATAGEGETTRDFWKKSNAYIPPILELRGTNISIGITVDEDQRLTVTRLRTELHPHPVFMRSVRGGPAEYLRGEERRGRRGRGADGWRRVRPRGGVDRNGDGRHPRPFHADDTPGSRHGRSRGTRRKQPGIRRGVQRLLRFA